MNEPVTVTPGGAVEQEELRELYASVGWAAYTRDPDSLYRAIGNSTFVATARADELLVGLARVMSDDVAIAYLQDILVRPDFQHRGVGSTLLDTCLERFGHVRQKVLITDDQESQHSFYRANGFSDTADLDSVDLHTFVRIAGLND